MRCSPPSVSPVSRSIVDGSGADRTRRDALVARSLAPTRSRRRPRWRPSSRPPSPTGGRTCGGPHCASSSRNPSTVGVGCRGGRARRRSGDQFHRRPGLGADEGGPVRHQRQATAGRVPHRSARPDEPGAEYPRRARRCDGRRRHAVGASSSRATRRRRRTSPPSRGESPRRPRRPFFVVPGRVPDDPHARERPAARRRAAARVRRRSAGADPRCSNPPKA